jgi:hypothetical protein
MKGTYKHFNVLCIRNDSYSVKGAQLIDPEWLFNLIKRPLYSILDWTKLAPTDKGRDRSSSLTAWKHSIIYTVSLCLFVSPCLAKGQANGARGLSKFPIQSSPLVATAHKESERPFNNFNMKFIRYASLIYALAAVLEASPDSRLKACW